MGSPQTLSEADRRIVAAWAADCAERVLGLFEAEAPGDSRPRHAIARLRAFSRGELGVGEARRRFVAHAAARQVSVPAAVAAARAAGQAASVPHMGAHALGAAAYAAKASGLAVPERPEAVSEEIRWQIGRMSAAARAALRELPPVGENASGLLGPGLLTSGLLGRIIRDLQARLADPDLSEPMEDARTTGLGSGVGVIVLCRFPVTLPPQSRGFGAAEAGRPRAVATRRRPHPPPSRYCLSPVGTVNGAGEGEGSGRHRTRS